MWLADTSIKRPVFATMLVLALVVFGVVSYPSIGVDLFPKVDFPVVNIRTVLRGASPEIMDVVGASGRGTVVLVGLETDVCVSHSALGLLEAGYAVAVVADATGSPGTGHQFGLERMRDAGVAVLGAKNLYYEWVPTVERANELAERVRALGVPEGVIL